MSEKMSDEWWVMSYEWWVMSDEWWKLSDGNWVMKNAKPNKPLSADQLLNIEHQVSTRTCPAKSKFRILALFFNLDFGLYVSEDKY